MRSMFLFLMMGCVSATLPSEQHFTTITFPSKDGVEITADLYVKDKSKPFLILCHQAGFSRGEYRETAPKLMALGFNCLALDQRSGREAAGVRNETHVKAKAANKKTSYMDAEQDILAAVDLVYSNHSQHIILVGSSYSASLVLKIAKENDKVQAVVAFSPGEYLKGVDLQQAIAGLDKPVWATSSRSEADQVEGVLAKVPESADRVHFVPTKAGIHGSRALWVEVANHEEYWDALKLFLVGVGKE